MMRSQFALWIGGAIVVALLVHFGLRWKTANVPLTIEYSAFLDHVDSGHVERVEIVSGSRIRGTFRADAVRRGRNGPERRSGRGRAAGLRHH